MILRRWVRRAANRGSLSPRSGAPLAATITRIARGAFLRPLVSGGPVAGRRSRRARHCLLRTAYFLGPGSMSGAFSFFAGHFRARQRREIYDSSAILASFFLPTPQVIYRRSQAVDRPMLGR